MSKNDRQQVSQMHRVLVLLVLSAGVVVLVVGRLWWDSDTWAYTGIGLVFVAVGMVAGGWLQQWITHR